MVDIPEELDASFCATPGSVHQNLNQHGSRYTLYGISHHSGSLNGGHYVAETMNADTGEWYDCNDSSVKKIKGGIDK